MPHQADDNGQDAQALVTHTRRTGPIQWPDDIPAIKAAFLEEYVANGGIIAHAANAAGVSRETIRNWARRDEQFALAFEDAKQEANDTLRRELVRRATEGWQHEVYQQGRFVGYETVKSDNLLMFLMKSRMPEFRDRVDITSNDQHINARETIVEAANDAETTDLAARLLERLAGTGIGPDASGSGVDS